MAVNASSGIVFLLERIHLKYPLSIPLQSSVLYYSCTYTYFDVKGGCHFCMLNVKHYRLDQASTLEKLEMLKELIVETK